MTLDEMEKQLKATQTALGELQKRVTITEDIQQIHQLQRRYVNALICTEWDECADCFSENGRVDVYLHDPVEGRESIRKWFKEELSITHAGKEGDILVQPEITIDGDRAEGKWLLYMMSLPGHRPDALLRPGVLQERVREGEGGMAHQPHDSERAHGSARRRSAHGPLVVLSALLHASGRPLPGNQDRCPLSSRAAWGRTRACLLEPHTVLCVKRLKLTWSRKRGSRMRSDRVIPTSLSRYLSDLSLSAATQGTQGAGPDSLPLCRE